MKKLTAPFLNRIFPAALIAGLFLINDPAFAQSGQKFATGGNTLSSGEFLGTLNNYPIDVKVNNTLRGSFTSTGFDIYGTAHSTSAVVDSILSSWQVMVSDALSVGGNLSVSGNAAITGIFTAGQILIDGNSITSSGGSIIFPGNDLSKINNLYTSNIESGTINSTMYLLNGVLIDFNAIDSNIISLQSAINDMPSSPWVSADTGIVYVDNGGSNFANASYSTITGGQSNTIDPLATYGVISGGQDNYIHNASTPTFGHSHSFIGGGQNNSIQSSSGFSVIAGGSGNIAGGPYSVVAGGENNQSTGSHSGILTGTGNSIALRASHGLIAGGSGNSINNAAGFVQEYNFIGNGNSNTIEHNTSNATILNGTGNLIQQGANRSVILNGSNITASQPNTAYTPNLEIQGGLARYNAERHSLYDSLTLVDKGYVDVSISAQETQLDSLSLTTTSLQSSVSDLAMGQAGQQSAIGNLQSQIDSLSTTTSNLQSSVSDLAIGQVSQQSAIGNLQLQIDSLSTTTSNLQSSVSDLTAEQSLQQQQIDSIQANLGSGLAFSTGTGQYSAINNQSGTNSANALNSFIGAGQNNLIDSNAQYGVIIGGKNNIIHNDGFPLNGHRYNFIGNGISNYTEASVNNSSVLNGNNNSIKAGANAATVIGGENNSVSGLYGIVGGGRNNQVQSPYSIIAGGQNNLIQTAASHSAILSGRNNQIQNVSGPIQQLNVITGGDLNIIQSDVSNATVVGGSGNTIQSGANRTVILGGVGITAKTSDAAYVTKLAYNETGTAFDGLLEKTTLTSDQSWTLPDKSGTIALISDLEANPSMPLSGDTMSGNITMASGTSLTHSTSNGKLTFDALALTNAIGLGYNISAPSASSQGLVVAPAGTTGYPGGFVAAGFNASSTLGQGLAVIPAGHPSYPNGVLSLHDGNAEGTVHIGTGDITIGQRINLNGFDKKIRIENDGGDKIILEGINNPSLWETTQGITIAPKAGVTLAGPVMTIEGEVNLSGDVVSNGRIKTNRIAPLDGDSIIYFGNNSLEYNDAGNQLGWTTDGLVKGGRFGNGASYAFGLNSIAIGTNVSTSVAGAITIGGGESTFLTNNIENSLMVGFNSGKPTLFVGPSPSVQGTGNVGIGTHNPNSKLDVRMPVQDNSIVAMLKDNDSNGLFIVPKLGEAGYNYHSKAGDVGIFWDGYNPQADLVIGPWKSDDWAGMKITRTGNIGIKTNNPNETLDVIGTAYFDGNVGVGTGKVVPVSLMTAKFNVTSSGQHLVRYQYTGDLSTPTFDITGLPNEINLRAPFAGIDLTLGVHSVYQAIVISGENGSTKGFVGIGTNDPQYPLDVAGTVRMKEAKVCMTGCDFVFEPDYGLMPLKKRREIVSKDKHLPQIKPARDMEKNGAFLGEVASGLLQNLEEHELYLYDHDEKINLILKENNELKIQIENMKQIIEQLKPATGKK